MYIPEYDDLVSGDYDDSYFEYEQVMGMGTQVDQFWQPGTNDISCMPEGRLLLIEYVNFFNDKYTCLVYIESGTIKTNDGVAFLLERRRITRWAIVPD